MQVRNEGTGALYAGLSAALARQASYTTLRLGLYDFMKQVVLDCEHDAVRPTTDDVIVDDCAYEFMRKEVPSA